MDVQVEPGVWTFVADTGVEVRYDGHGTQTVRVDEQGAVVLPALTPQEEIHAVWMVRPGRVPVYRNGQPFDLKRPELWPAGFALVDGGWLQS